MTNQSPSCRRIASSAHVISKLPLSRSLLSTLIAVAVLLLSVAGVGAAEEPPAGAGSLTLGAEEQRDADPDESAGGAEVVRYAGWDQYELSLAVAQALVDADGGTSEWVVLASGESWSDAAAAGPLAGC